MNVGKTQFKHSVGLFDNTPLSGISKDAFTGRHMRAHIHTLLFPPLIKGQAASLKPGLLPMVLINMDIQLANRRGKF